MLYMKKEKYLSIQTISKRKREGKLHKKQDDINSYIKNNPCNTSYCRATTFTSDL